MPSRSILLVAHFYPPSGEVAADRPAWLARHLRRLGHRVRVVTTSAYGRLPDDEADAVTRTTDMQLWQAKLRGQDTWQTSSEEDTYAKRPHPATRVLVPDPLVVAWTPFARRAANRLARAEKVDCVITTSGPESAHKVGRALQRRGSAWIADLRDGWTFERVDDNWPTGFQHAYNRRLERRLLGAADGVSVVAEPMAEDLRERLGIDAEVIPNGWDPESPRAGGESRDDGDDLLDPERFSIVFTGRLAVYNRDPAPVVEALAGLAREDPDLAARIELVFAGPLTSEERELLGRDVSPARIKLAGKLPPERVHAMQAAADAALHITAGETRRHEVGNKVFEYLGAGRPIIAIAEPDNAAAVIIKEAGAGVIVPVGDVAAIKAALRDAVEGRIEAAGPRAAQPYSRPALSERMAGLVERAIVARARRRR